MRDSTNCDRIDTADVARAVAELRSGHVVALPTETVYGLAANALDTAAVARIFAAKGRPAENPIIVHVADIAMAQTCVREWPDLAQKLADAFWPGPLTLVLPKSERIPPMVTAGGDTVGIRCPKHPVFQAILQQCGFPLAAPSANLSGQISPTTAEHVRQSLGDRIPLIVDGGPAEIGIESTVLDLSVRPPVILRPGMIHEESLSAVTGSLRQKPTRAHGVLRSPGMLLTHYAPKAKVWILPGADWAELRDKAARERWLPDQVHVLSWSGLSAGMEGCRSCRMPSNPVAYAKALYSEFHRCDAEKARWIVVESVPNTTEWQGIADRLKRAAAEL